MNNKEFIAELSQRSGYTQADTQKLISTIIDEMGRNFDEGNSVSFSHFGTFEVRKRLERMVINPSTGKRMLVPPKLVLNFKPNIYIKDKLKNKEQGDE
ncbi:HU family DNA-binding protein [Prevotella sp. oral taxon 376]|uniref:HU family DNA-binding protein n=1 Tax=Prevotella sp. oral taxon 376 TaxID=712466 RepID=UPI000D1EB739|nr:HU family DNA-binding protein [Prevotella sp. oral taxon 376]PTL32604.1 HU family DNA-binding protein [Prevotella sp. oral taxon 376]